MAKAKTNAVLFFENSDLRVALGACLKAFDSLDEREECAKRSALRRWYGTNVTRLRKRISELLD